MPPKPDVRPTEIARRPGRSHPPSLVRLAERLIRDEQLIERGDVVLCACSGGPDSTALLSVLARLRSRLGFTLVAHGVDHGLRPEARAELGHAERLCSALGVPFSITRVHVEPGGNVQARAREARRAALREAARLAGARLVATGHTADDRAETFLLRLLRGAGPRGLAVLPPSAPLPDEDPHARGDQRAPTRSPPQQSDREAHLPAVTREQPHKEQKPRGRSDVGERAVSAQRGLGKGTPAPADPQKTSTRAANHLEEHARQHLEEHARQHLEAHARQHLEAHARQHLEAHARPHLEEHARQHLEAHARRHLEDELPAEPARRRTAQAPLMLIRPLLLARRADVEAHLARHGIEVARDPSNDDARFLRVRVRKELLPLLEELSPKIAEHLCALADMLPRASDDAGPDRNPEEPPGSLSEPQIGDAQPGDVRLGELGRAQRLAIARAKKCERPVKLLLRGGREVMVGFSSGKAVLMKGSRPDGPRRASK